VLEGKGESMLPREPKKKRNDLTYLLWFVIISLLLHSIIVFILALFGFQGGSFNKLKDLFAKEAREKKPTFVMFHDEKPKATKQPDTPKPSEKLEEKESLQEKKQPDLEKKKVEQEAPQAQNQLLEQEPPPSIINTSPAKLVAPLSAFGYPDAQAEPTFHPELPDSNQGDIIKVESATPQQPEEPGSLEKKRAAKESHHEPAEKVAPIQQAKKNKQLKQEKKSQKRGSKKNHKAQEDIQDLLIQELKNSIVDEAQDKKQVQDQEHEDHPKDLIETHDEIDDIEDVEVIESTENTSSALLEKIRNVKQVPEQETIGLDVQGPEMVVRGARKEVPDQEPRKKNILALTKGFVEKLTGENGTDLIDRDGDPNKKPTFEELKFLSYEAKINWALQASWKQNIEHSQKHKPIPGTVDVAFVIDARGIPQNITIMQSSGMQDLDQTIVHNIKNAAPFPPIPEHLNMAEYPVRRSIRVYLFGRGF
jgi:TonB family protein